MDKKISIVTLLISILTIVTITIGTSYSLWTTSVQQESTNTIDVGCFKVTFTDTGFEGAGNISLSNAYPMTDTAGKLLQPYKFSVANTCSVAASYSINLETLLDSTMDETKLNVYFDDKDVKPYVSSDFSELAEDVKNSMKLFQGYLGAGDSVTYNLRIWINYDVDVNTPNIQGATWNGRVVLNSEATFTKPVLTNKVVGEDSVTLDIDTKNEKTVQTLECYYGNDKVQSTAGTAVGTTKCQFPLTAEYAKFKVTYSDGTSDSSYPKQLVKYLIKDGKMVHDFIPSTDAKMTLEDGYLNFVVDNGGRGGISTLNPLDFSKINNIYFDISFEQTAFQAPAMETYFVIPKNGLSYFDKSDSVTEKVMFAQYYSSYSLPRTTFSYVLDKDNEYNNTILEIGRNACSTNILSMNIYNIYLQLAE